MTATADYLIRRELRAGDAHEIAELHRRVYVPEFGCNEEFVRRVAAGVTAAVACGWPDVAGAVWLVQRGGAVCGSLALTDEGDGLGRVRWFVLERPLRGHGLGRSLVAELIARARADGYRRLELETFSALTAAAADLPRRRLSPDVGARAPRLGPADHLPALRADARLRTMRALCPRHPAGVQRAPGAPGSCCTARVERTLEVLLVHPGGPAWAKRDLGAWSIPKGEYKPDEDPLQAARREFEEELGSPPPGGGAEGPRRDPAEVRARSCAPGRSKATSTRRRCAATRSSSNGRRAQASGSRSPRSTGREWFGLETAREKINPAQVALLERLEELWW